MQVHCINKSKLCRVEKIKSNSILLNSALPHFLNEWVASNNKRLIHLSTDCVFSGRKGNYLDNDIKDAYDLYGSTKSLGEIVDSKFAITLRGSMIGRELENKTELFEWFLKQSNKNIKGFSKVIYSGITTVKMAEIVLRIINYYPNLTNAKSFWAQTDHRFKHRYFFDSSKTFGISQSLRFQKVRYQYTDKTRDTTFYGNKYNFTKNKFNINTDINNRWIENE